MLTKALKGGVIMKKLCGILILSVFFQSCSGLKPIIMDPTIPEEQCAKIYFTNFSPTSLNGIKLNNDEYYRGYVITPAEKSISFTGDWIGVIRIVATPINYTAEEMEFSYKFENGKTYLVEGVILDYTDNGIWLLPTVNSTGVRIYDNLRESSGIPTPVDKENPTASVPFRRQPQFRHP
jgi:hypothetical protein